MSDYIARVELHGATWPRDYDTLHTLLEQHGFVNCIADRDGTKLRLPTGTYWSTGRVDDVALVRNAVQNAADATGYANESIVVKSGGWGSALSKKC